MNKILIVEDNKKGSQILKEVLEKEGYEVIVANDGIEGFRMAKKEIPDLVLLDLLLPKISGFDICIKLMEDEKTRRIPIIVISTLAEDKLTYEKLKKCEVLRFMRKPYSMDELLGEVKKVLNEKK